MNILSILMATPSQDVLSPDKAHWLGILDRALIDRVMRATRLHTVSAGELIDGFQDEPGGLFAVESGSMAVQIDDEDTGMGLGHVLGPGAWFGEASVITEGRRPIRVLALSESRLLCLPVSAWTALAEVDPVLWRGIAQLSADNTALAIRVARDLMIRAPERRCVATLSRLAGHGSTPVHLPITQSQFANMCRLSRGVAAKNLARMERAGVALRRYGGITIPDPAALARFAR